MFTDLNPVRLRQTGTLLCLAGLGLYLATLLVFEGRPLTLEIANTLTWLKAAAWTALGLAVVGGLILVVSVFLHRR